MKVRGEAIARRQSLQGGEVGNLSGAPQSKGKEQNGSSCGDTVSPITPQGMRGDSAQKTDKVGLRQGPGGVFKGKYPKKCADNGARVLKDSMNRHGSCRRKEKKVCEDREKFGNKNSEFY